MDLIAPNPYQPRLNFDEAKLEELAQSIRANGLIQPIVVRRAGGAKSGAVAADTASPYEIIAGERRWRAAQRAGLLRVPVLVKDVPDEKLLEVALIENIQREDLNPIDEALAYRRLIDDFHLTQEALATRRRQGPVVCRELLAAVEVTGFCPQGSGVRRAVDGTRAGAAGDRAGSRARARRARSARAASCRSARPRRWRRRRTNPRPPSPRRLPSEAEAAEPPDVHTRKAEETMRLSLGTRVHIRRKGKGGRIEIEFVSEDELHRLYEYITERR